MIQPDPWGTESLFIKRRVETHTCPYPPPPFLQLYKAKRLSVRIFWPHWLKSKHGNYTCKQGGLTRSSSKLYMLVTFQIDCICTGPPPCPDVPLPALTHTGPPSCPDMRGRTNIKGYVNKYNYQLYNLNNLHL